MDPRFADDLEEVLERAWAAGLRAIVCPGYDLHSSEQAVELAAQHPRLFAAVGIHPNYAAQAGPGDMARIAELARSPDVVAIGETGLDNYHQFTPPEVQERFLHAHLELAVETDLPVVIHNRDANERITTLLETWQTGALGQKGVLHCFSGDRAMLERCQVAGFYVSFAGPLTYRRPGWLPEAAREVAADRVLVETDAPYLAPTPVRGRRNEPAHVVHTLRYLAAARGVTYEAVAELTSRNAARLFRGLERAFGLRA
jgi:TatD DNase family protein